MIRVLVAGAAGKMGSEVVRAVSAADGMEVVALVDPVAAERGVTVADAAGTLLPCVADLAEAISASHADVMVDFTHPSVVEGNLRTALAAGVDCVVGTTGLTDAHLHALAAGAAPDTCLFVAPNFAIGAVLMMQFAQQAAKYLPHVEVIELHHDRKADAPSGTALRTATLIAAARAETPEVPGRDTENPGMEGARGAVVDGIHVHSVRLPGLVAHQEVLFGGQGQTLSIRHDSIDRTSFMPGVVLAVSKVGALSGLVVGLEALMGDDE
jgi:4-hydroxy-tetrahydrodipicolinate reductase